MQHTYNCFAPSDQHQHSFSIATTDENDHITYSKETIIYSFTNKKTHK